MRPINSISAYHHTYGVSKKTEQDQAAADQALEENNDSLDDNDDSFHDAREDHEPSHDFKNNQSLISKASGQQSTTTANAISEEDNITNPSSSAYVNNQNDRKSQGWFSSFMNCINVNLCPDPISEDSKPLHRLTPNFINSKHVHNLSQIELLHEKIAKESSFLNHILKEHGSGSKKDIKIYINELAKANLSAEEIQKFNEVWWRAAGGEAFRQTYEAAIAGGTAYLFSDNPWAFLTTGLIGAVRVSSNALNTFGKITEKAVQMLIEESHQEFLKLDHNLNKLLLEENIRQQSKGHFVAISAGMHENKAQLLLLKAAVEKRIANLKDSLAQTNLAISEDDESGYDSDLDLIVYDQNSKEVIESESVLNDDFEMVPETKNELFWSNLQSVSNPTLKKADIKEKAIDSVGDSNFLKSFFISAKMTFVDSIKWIKSWVPDQLIGRLQAPITHKQRYLDEIKKLQTIDSSLRHRSRIFGDKKPFLAFNKVLGGPKNWIAKKLVKEQINIGEHAVERLRGMQANEISEISIAIGRTGGDQVEFASNPVTARAVSWYLFAEAAELNSLTRDIKAGEMQIISSDPNHKIFNFLTSAMEAQTYLKTKHIDDTMVYEQVVIGMDMEGQTLPNRSKSLTFEKLGSATDAQLIITFNREKLIVDTPTLWLEPEKIESMLPYVNATTSSSLETKHNDIESDIYYSQLNDAEKDVLVQELESILPEDNIEKYKNKLEILNEKIIDEDANLASLHLRLDSFDHWNVVNSYEPKMTNLEVTEPKLAFDKNGSAIFD